MTFAEKLKQLREKAGLTQAQLAAASGRSLGAIRDYEQGLKEPTLQAALKLAAALGASVEEFSECELGDTEQATVKQRGRPRTRQPASNAPAPKRPHSRPRKGK